MIKVWVKIAILFAAAFTLGPIGLGITALLMGASWSKPGARAISDMIDEDVKAAKKKEG